MIDDINNILKNRIKIFLLLMSFILLNLIYDVPGNEMYKYRNYEYFLFVKINFIKVSSSKIREYVN